ncbi:MAG: VOC family protein [Planctomycetota bacterium]
MSNGSQSGRIGWVDLTVADGQGVADFYRDVVGWKTDPVSMGDYDDFCMVPQTGGDAVCGVCHARGTNSDIPPVWMLYFVVDDVEASAKIVTERGGKLRREIRPLAGGRFCVIEDPAGAVCALYQAPANS